MFYRNVMGFLVGFSMFSMGSVAWGAPLLQVRSGNMGAIPHGTTEISVFSGTNLGMGAVGYSSYGHGTYTQFDLVNDGDSNLVINSTSLTGGGASHFYISEAPSPGQVVSAGGHAVLVVRTSPQTVGFHTATVNISSNDPTRPDYAFNVGVTGVPNFETPRLTDFWGTISSIKVTPVYRGGIVTKTRVEVIVDCENNGAEKGRPGGLSLFVSSDSVLDSTDIMVRRKKVKPILALFTVPRKIRFTYPGELIPGMHLFGVLESPADGAAEYNACNNGAAVKF